MNVSDWLCDGDAAIRWQTLRDLAGASPAQANAARARVANEGLAAEILAQQQPDGAWRCPGEPAWLTTLFTLQLLRATGVDPADPKVVRAMQLAETNLRWNTHEGCWDIRSPEFGGNNFFQGEEEPCINGGVLAFGSYFGHPKEQLARRLLSEQLADGGWNCDAPKSVCSSYHTTICVLEGLLEYERARGAAPEIVAARRRGEEYLLARGLFRRLSTGEVANPEFLQFAYPPRYHYDVLRAFDYFKAAAAQAAARRDVQADVQSDIHARPQQNVQPDPRIDARFSEALQIVESRRQPDGRWLLDQSYADSLALPFAERVGEPSRWNTLRALRVLRWAGRSRPDPTTALP